MTVRAKMLDQELIRMPWLDGTRDHKPIPGSNPRITMMQGVSKAIWEFVGQDETKYWDLMMSPFDEIAKVVTLTNEQGLVMGSSFCMGIKDYEWGRKPVMENDAIRPLCIVVVFGRGELHRRTKGYSEGLEKH
jgi:hypothetical protein